MPVLFLAPCILIIVSNPIVWILIFFQSNLCYNSTKIDYIISRRVTRQFWCTLYNNNNESNIPIKLILCLIFVQSPFSNLSTSMQIRAFDTFNSNPMCCNLFFVLAVSILRVNLIYALNIPT